jgi:predicted nucleic acid-binding protein
MKIMLDTTVLIDILKGDKKATDTVDGVKADASLYTTTVNIYEMMRGIYLLPQKSREPHLKAVKALTCNLMVLGLDLEASEKAASIYAELRARGMEIDEPDYLIAGICLANGVGTLITRNEKHFGNIKGLTVITY